MIVDTQHIIRLKDATCKYDGEFSIKDTQLAPLSPLHDVMNFASVDVDVSSVPTDVQSTPKIAAESSCSCPYISVVNETSRSNVFE